MDAKTLVTEAVSGKHSELANKLTDQLERLGELDREFSSMIEKAKTENDEDTLNMLNQTIESAIGDGQDGLVAAVEGINQVLSLIVSFHINRKYTNIL